MARNFRELEARMAPERLAAARAEAMRQTEESVDAVMHALAARRPGVMPDDDDDAAAWTSLAALQLMARSLGGELDVVVRLPGRQIVLSELARGRAVDAAEPVVAEPVVAEPVGV